MADVFGCGRRLFFSIPAVWLVKNMQKSVRLCSLVAVSWMIWCAGKVTAAEPQADSSPLANELVATHGDQHSWNRSCLFALCALTGVPERQFIESWPGIKLESLPPKVLETLRQGSEGISDWVVCISDQRPTSIIENDLFTGGSSKKAKEIACGTLALEVLATLTPSSLLKDLAAEDGRRTETLAKTFRNWQQLLHPLSAEKRMREWFDRAGEYQRRMFLVLALQTRYAPAYPLLEADFLARAAKPDDFLYLDVSAYVRQRRDEAADLCSQLSEKLPKHADAEHAKFFQESWRLLTTYAALGPAIQDWRAGQMPLHSLAELLERSIDQPWAYHSMPIEPIFMHRPIVEANLKSLISGARQEQELEKRVTLLRLAIRATELLTEIRHRTDVQDRLPRIRVDSPDLKSTVENLRALLIDNRIALGNYSVETPSERGAEIVWRLWGPNTVHLDTIFNNEASDWRGDSTDFLWGSSRPLLVEAAGDFLTHAATNEPRPFPKEEAATLVRQFMLGDAQQWRRQLAALRWDERLLVQAQATKDPEFAARLWPRMLEFVELTFAESVEHSPSLDHLWRERLVGKDLDDTSWTVLRDWVATEARAGRWRWIVVEAFPCRPGISLYVFPTPASIASADTVPMLTSRVAGSMFLLLQEQYRIAPDSLELQLPDKDSSSDTRPTLIEALRTQSLLTAKDAKARVEGFVVHLFALPPKK